MRKIFAADWPDDDEHAPHGGIAKLFKDIKKYVVLTLRRGRYRLGGLSAPARHRRRPAPEAGRRSEPRHPGHTELVHAQLAYDLVDAMSIFTVPVVLGGGKKLFADGCRRR